MAGVTRGIVHVIDPLGGGPASGVGGRSLLGAGAAADVAVLACAEAIRARPGDAHAVVVLGAPCAAEHAGRLGLDAHAVVPALFGHAGLAGRELRRVVRTLGGADVLQPWSERARTACRLATLGAGAVGPVPSGTFPSLDARLGGDRAATREALGVGDGTPMVALLADPVRHADARRFVYMVGLLDVAGIPIAGLIDRRAAHVSRARRFHAEAGVGWRMLLPQEPTAALLHACDLAVVVTPEVRAELSGPERAWVRWSVLRAHLLGVPVIGGEAWLPGGAWPGEAAGVLRARSESVTDIGRQLARIASDGAMVGMLSRAVRGAAAGFATRERFGAALGALWSGVEPFEEGAALAVAS